MYDISDNWVQLWTDGEHTKTRKSGVDWLSFHQNDHNPGSFVVGRDHHWDNGMSMRIFWHGQTGGPPLVNENNGDGMYEALIRTATSLEVVEIGYHSRRNYSRNLKHDH